MSLYILCIISHCVILTVIELRFICVSPPVLDPYLQATELQFNSLFVFVYLEKNALCFCLCLHVCVYRQPPNVHLFPSGPSFVVVTEAVLAGVSSSCLLVATQAAGAAFALFRYTQTRCGYINKSHMVKDT